MKKSLFALLFLLTIGNAFSQGEANWWYFGQNAGLNFPFGPPVSVLGGTLNTMEGVATASNGAGNLMFYTDGLTVRNATHAVMANGNGLMGDPSSTQSAIVVKRPGSAIEYFVFTAGLPPGGSYRYSIIDMSLNGGLGGVTGTKNVLMYAPCTERITAVKHCNNIDYWIITHHWGSNEFRVYLLTAAGVNPIPIVSTVGSVSSGSTANAIGYLKASHDGNKLAMATRYSQGGSPAQGFVELFDFNNTTGVVSNPLNMGIHPYAYGVEFSPDGSRLYTNQSQPCIIYQFNMCAGSPGAIVASKTQIGTSPNGWAGALQLGPDNKIYHARIFANSIARINNPNTLGVGCGYVDNTIMLPGGTQCLGGLPNFPASYFSIFPPTVSATINMNNCYEATFSFVTPPPSCTGSGTPQSVSWNFGDPGSGVNNFSNLNNPSHIFTGAGSFIVTLIVNYQCYSDSDTILVNIIPCGITTSVNNDSICAGSCGSITATTTGNSGPVTYAWTPNIGVGPGPHVVCPPNTTTYQVIATDSVGNKDTAYATVVVNPLPTTTTSVTNVSCFGGMNGTATANPSGTAPFTYLWNSNPIQTTQTATGLSAGNYTVTVTDANGCFVSANVTITEPPLLTASINQFTNVTCFGLNNGAATVTPGGGNPNYTYSWNSVPVQTTQTATGLPPGNYTVTVTDANGCSVTAFVSISEPPVLTANINSYNNVTCFGFNNGTATVTTVGGTPSYTYSWNSVPVQTTQTATSLPPGNYTVTVTDANGCITTVTVTITEPSAIVLNTSVTPAICGQQIGTATVNATGGTGSYTYSWNSNPIQTTPTAIGLATGSYIVTVTDSNGCVETATVFVPFSNSFSINSYVINHVSCFGGSNGSAGVTLNGGTSPFTYNWSSGGTNPTETNLPAGIYNIVVTDSAGCVDSSVIVITEPPVLSVSIIPDAISVCVGDNVTLSTQTSGGSGNYFYIWNPGGQNTATVQFNAVASGQYSVTVTDANGCTDNAVAFVTVNPLPIADFTVDTTNGCAPVCVNFLSATTSDSYSWSFGDSGNGTGFMPNYCYSKFGSYSVTLMVTDSNGCKNSVTKTNLITVYPVPVADFFPSPFRTDIYSAEITFTNTSDGATTAFWNFADGYTSNLYNEVHTYAEPGKYGVHLTVCNTYGCCDTITKFVKVDGSFTYFVPSAFTIDEDHLNEVFFAKGIGIDTERYLLQIFDRWGELIWETTDLNQGWNGIVKNGKIANSAVYVWKASVWEKDKNLHHNFIGHVTLLR